jgi:CDP-6-deoxy-D-xylo-4-hexulose-3-dehydrase
MSNDRVGMLRPGDEVLVPAVTWPTQIWPWLMAGLRVRLADVDPKTLNTNADLLGDVWTRGTFGVSLVHLLGNPLPMPSIYQWATARSLAVMEDACESLGARSDNRMVGTWGEVGTYSFFFSHQMTTMEGGMIVTDERDVADTCRLLRSHGWDRNPDYRFDDWGFNVRPLEIQAAMGLAQLRVLPDFISQRHINYALFYSQLYDFMPIATNTKGFSPMGVPLMFPQEETRDRVRDGLRHNHVECRPIVAGNMARHPATRRYKVTFDDLPGADKVHDCGLYVGLHVETEPDRIHEVCDLIKKFAT